MSLGAVVGVLKVVDKVLSNDRVQGALLGDKPLRPTPAINGVDQRLDVVIYELRRSNALLEQLVELKAAGLRMAVEQARPAATMELLPEVARQAAEADGLDLAQHDDEFEKRLRMAVEQARSERAQHDEFEQRVADEVASGGALRKKRR